MFLFSVSFLLFSDKRTASTKVSLLAIISLTFSWSPRRTAINSGDLAETGCRVHLASNKGGSVTWDLHVNSQSTIGSSEFTTAYNSLYIEGRDFGEITGRRTAPYLAGPIVGLLSIAATFTVVSMLRRAWVWGSRRMVAVSRVLIATSTSLPIVKKESSGIIRRSKKAYWGLSNKARKPSSAVFFWPSQWLQSLLHRRLPEVLAPRRKPGREPREEKAFGWIPTGKRGTTWALNIHSWLRLLKSNWLWQFIQTSLITQAWGSEDAPVETTANKAI